MKCPYCASELEQGFVQSSGGIIWSKKKKLIAGYASQSSDVHIAAGFGGAYKEAYHCPGCKKIIIPLDGKME